MKTLSGLGIGLSLVFGGLLFALVAELYYLLWWKKKRTVMNSAEIEEEENNYAKEFFQFICWRRSSSSQTNSNLESSRNLFSNGDEAEDPELVLKNFGEEGVESELMRLHNLAGPPRFLCSIKEETKEDLESEDGKSRSLSDLVMAADTPLFTPLASPPLKASPSNSLDSYQRHGFNPHIESSAENELISLRSSPPPKFKFLIDAEEKLYRRLKEEARQKTRSSSTMAGGGEKDEHFSIVIHKNEEKEAQNHPTLHSSSSQREKFVRRSSERNDRTFKLTDPSSEHCPPGEFIRIPGYAKLQAYGDEMGTGLEIVVPKRRVGPEELEVFNCLRPHLVANELLLS